MPPSLATQSSPSPDWQVVTHKQTKILPREVLDYPTPLLPLSVCLELLYSSSIPSGTYKQFFLQLDPHCDPLFFTCSLFCFQVLQFELYFFCSCFSFIVAHDPFRNLNQHNPGSVEFSRYLRIHTANLLWPDLCIVSCNFSVNYFCLID